MLAVLCFSGIICYELLTGFTVRLLQNDIYFDWLNVSLIVCLRQGFSEFHFISHLLPDTYLSSAQSRYAMEFNENVGVFLFFDGVFHKYLNDNYIACQTFSLFETYVQTHTLAWKILAWLHQLFCSFHGCVFLLFIPNSGLLKIWHYLRCCHFFILCYVSSLL